MAQNHETEVESLRGHLQGPDHWGAVYGLRGVEELWARELLGITGRGTLATLVRKWVERGVNTVAAAEAETHLAQAEDWQWQIGSCATGAGEGLASMSNVYDLKMARAWLNAAIAVAGDDKRETAALALVTEVAGDPNRLGKAHAKSIAALKAFLQEPRAQRGT